MDDLQKQLAAALKRIEDLERKIAPEKDARDEVSGRKIISRSNSKKPGTKAGGRVNKPKKFSEDTSLIILNRERQFEALDTFIDRISVEAAVADLQTLRASSDPKIKKFVIQTDAHISGAWDKIRTFAHKKELDLSEFLTLELLSFISSRSFERQGFTFSRSRTALKRSILNKFATNYSPAEKALQDDLIEAYKNCNLTLQSFVDNNNSPAELKEICIPRFTSEGEIRLPGFAHLINDLVDYCVLYINCRYLENFRLDRRQIDPLPPDQKLDRTRDDYYDLVDPQTNPLRVNPGDTRGLPLGRRNLLYSVLHEIAHKYPDAGISFPEDELFKKLAAARLAREAGASQ